MNEFVGKRFQHINNLGLVYNTKYTRCFWPFFTEPVEFFSSESSGIIVEGPPTPRNVVFPTDTVFVQTREDCFFVGVIDPENSTDVLDATIPDNRIEIPKNKAEDIAKEKDKDKKKQKIRKASEGI